MYVPFFFGIFAQLAHTEEISTSQAEKVGSYTHKMRTLERIRSHPTNVIKLAESHMGSKF